MSKNIMQGVYTGHNDKNEKKIYYETSILKLPNGKIARLNFDEGRLDSYYADLKGYCIYELKGVNNCNSFYLCDCEVVEK